jgi:hypothetical protein
VHPLPSLTENNLIDEKNYTQNSIVEKQKKKIQISRHFFPKSFFFEFPQKVFLGHFKKEERKKKKTFLPKN